MIFLDLECFFNVKMFFSPFSFYIFPVYSNLKIITWIQINSLVLLVFRRLIRSRKNDLFLYINISKEIAREKNYVNGNIC